MARCSIQIDWLSAVLPITPRGEGSEQGHYSEEIARILRREIGEGLANDLFSGLQPLDYGRAPYQHGWQDKQSGITIWGGGALPHFCVEFSGKGVAHLREVGAEFSVLTSLADRFTRVDVAIDVETDLKPIALVSLREGGRQLTSSDMKSPSGETCYVGSMHSERYCRVYRYAEPHPRSHLLRVEAVFRRAYARACCAEIIGKGLESVAAGAMDFYGWSNFFEGCFTEEPTKLSVYRPERNGGKTLRWLIVQAAVSFRKLVKDGVIPDPHQFLEAYFLTDPDTNEPIA